MKVDLSHERTKNRSKTSSPNLRPETFHLRCRVGPRFLAHHWTEASLNRSTMGAKKRDRTFLKPKKLSPRSKVRLSRMTSRLKSSSLLLWRKMRKSQELLLKKRGIGTWKNELLSNITLMCSRIKLDLRYRCYSPIYWPLCSLLWTTTASNSHQIGLELRTTIITSSQLRRLSTLWQPRCGPETCLSPGRCTLNHSSPTEALHSMRLHKTSTLSLKEPCPLSDRVAKSKEPTSTTLTGLETQLVPFPNTLVHLLVSYPDPRLAELMRTNWIQSQSSIPYQPRRVILPLTIRKETGLSWRSCD